MVATGQLLVTLLTLTIPNMKQSLGKNDKRYPTRKIEGGQLTKGHKWPMSTCKVAVVRAKQNTLPSQTPSRRWEPQAETL